MELRAAERGEIRHPYLRPPYRKEGSCTLPSCRLSSRILQSDQARFGRVEFETVWSILIKLSGSSGTDDSFASSLGSRQFSDPRESCPLQPPSKFKGYRLEDHPDAGATGKCIQHHR